MKLVGLLVAVLFGVMVLGALATAMNVISLPGRVVTREVGTDRAIGNYEWFFDYNSQYQSRLAQIESYKKVADIQPLELESVRQACRSLANDYNAQSMKINKRWFKDSALPDQLEVGACEQ